MDTEKTKEGIVGKLKRHTPLVIGVGGAITIVVILTVVVVLVLGHDENSKPADHPALKVGQTSLSKAQYDKVVAQAKEQSVSKTDAERIIAESVRVQEAARQLGVMVPDALVAAQAQAETQIYVPYDQLSDYQKLQFYSKSFFVLIALIKDGGSIATLYHAPYNVASNAADNKAYARDLIGRVATYKDSNVTNGSGKGINDKMHALLALFISDGRSNYSDGVNVSGTRAVTNAGKSLVATKAQLVSLNELPVTSQDMSSQVSGLIAKTKTNEYSGVTELTDIPAYIVVWKEKTYAKDPDIVTKLQTVLQALGGEK